MTRLTTKARQVYELSGVFIALFWFLCVFVFGLLLDPGGPLDVRRTHVLSTMYGATKGVARRQGRNGA